MKYMSTADSLLYLYLYLYISAPSFFPFHITNSYMLYNLK